MKHFTQTTANGLHTPPCGSSHGNLSSFTLLTSLLLFFLLFVGSNAAWAGWRFQGQDGSNDGGAWNNGDNMTQVGSSDVWYYKISNLNADIQFKINNGNWGGDNQKYWSANHDDQNRGNVQLEDANDGDKDGKNRFKYSPSYNFGSNLSRDVYIFVKGDANNPSANDRVWAIAVRPGSGTISKQYSLRGDLWLGSVGGGWAGTADLSHNPTFVNMTNDVAAQCSYLIPIPSGSNAMKSRFTLVSAGTEKSADHYEAESSNLTNNSDNIKYRLTIPANGSSYPTVKRIVLDYYPTNGYVRAHLEDYIVKRDGWHLYVDNKYMGAMSNSGSFTIESMASGTHTMYIANYSHNSINSSTYDPYSDGGGKIHAQQWFGGLYIDVNPAHSNVTFESKTAYYNNGNDYFGPQTYPIAGTQDARGQFKINETSNVKFTFDGGVITINTLDGTEPDEVTYTGKEYVFLSKTQKHTDNNVFNFTADGAHLFVYFWNSETNANAWSDEAFMWDSGDNVLAAKAPAGTWTNCIIVRKNSNDNAKNMNNVWNQTADLALEEGKNYLQTGESSVWGVYTPPFYLTGSSVLCGEDWGYSGNNTVNNGTVTRENIPAGTYQFKLNPTKSYGGWDHQVNADFIASSGSNVDLSSVNDKQIQFTLSEASDVTIAYDGYGVTVNATPSAPEPLSGDYYVFGAGGTNWVTGWTRNVEANKMTIVDGVATKTFYNVSGQGLEFKIHKGETEYNNSLLLEEVGENNSHLIKKVWKNGTNIDFSISDINITHKADVTVHFDGEHIWLTAVPHPETVAGSDWYIMGSGNVGTTNSLSWDKNTQKGRGNEHKMTVQDGVATITYYNVPNNSISYKVFRGSDNYEINDFYYDASASSGIICTDQDGNDNINVSLNNQNICIHWDGTKIWTTEAAAPITTYTVTLHPNNGGDNIVRTSVPENSTASAAALNLSAVTYGAGTATWYTNAECTVPFTSVTEDNMDLYAKWGVSGNYYVVGDLQVASDASSTGNWDNNLGRQMTYPSSQPGVCSFSFVAPKGKTVFEIIKNKNWSEKLNGGSYAAVLDNANSDVTLSVEGGHISFTLDAPKLVTVSLDGKVKVTTADVAFDNSKTWRVKTSNTGWGADGNNWDWNTIMTNNGTTNATAILRNVPAGAHRFIISTETSDGEAYKYVGNNTFHALYVDTSNPSSGLTWNTNTVNLAGNVQANNIPHETNDNYERRCKFTLSAISDVCITFDGGKIRCDILPKYTVTFNSNGGSEVASQSVFEGATASEPSAPTKAGCNFQGWQLSGADYSFSEAVTGNITLDAVWANKPISSVELNESEHTTWVGNSDFVLTLTKNPSDLITKTIVWSSDAEGVASVSNGTVHAAGVGTATITCTVTDMFDTQRSATCEVTVAACQMTTDDLYSMTVTGYNSSTGDDATLTGLWNQSSDNTEPATLTVCNVRIGNNGGSNEYYAYDNNGTVSIEQRSSDDVDKWYRIEAATNLYYLKNVSTGKYMYVGSTNTESSKGNGWSENGDWLLRSVYTSTTNAETDSYKFYSAKDDWNNDIIISRADASNGAKATATDFVLSRQQLTGTPSVWSDVVANTVSASRGAKQGGNAYKGFQSAFENVENVANPNYKASQMNSSYYRMKADASVQANLANGLAYGSVITVRLYADAATTVQLTKADGTEIETIDLSADAAREYTYTVAYGSELVGATAFIIKAADNHAGIASIEVSRMHAVDPSSPALTWDADLSEGVTQSALAGTFQHVASSALSEGAIHYTSSNEAVATVAADGTVTPIMAGNTTITATIEQRECYAEQSINYNVTLTEPTLAEMIAADAGAGITLTHDYAENIVIDKAITINGAGHSVGNLTVETAGDLTLSGALTVNDFSIYAQAGNTTTPAASGQVRNAANLTANGNAYFYYTVDPNGHVQYGWYDFTVPFPVNVMTGIKGIQEGVLKENFVNETDYAIMEHLGDKQAAGQYAYKKFRGVMQPNKLYSITLDDDYNYNTVRFQKTNDGALVASDEVTLNTYASTVDDKHANWNGVGNGTLHHADAGLSVATIQVYQSGEKTFLPVNKNQYSLVIGSAFMVQQTGTMTLSQATHSPLLAPRRDASAQATAIQIAREGKPFSDQLYITADELAGQGYTQGVDVAKAGNIGNVNVPQIWTNAYNSKLCAHEAQLIDGEAQYTLSLYAPANGTYTLTSKNIPEGYTLYLTQNGNKLWDMSDTYVLDLTKGTTTEYGLLLVENYKMPTAVDNIFSNTDETTKIMRNGILYILQNGKVFNAQGARVK